MADFNEVYEKWLNYHMSYRKGESLRMLKEKHQFGGRLLVEHIWWPVLGHFDDLYPEYELRDEDGFYSYLDLAYLQWPRSTDIEADSFSNHARDISRPDFSRRNRRQNSIALEDWNILRFSVDDIKEDAAYCRRTLERMMDRWYGEEQRWWSHLPLRKREIIRKVIRSVKPITPSEAAVCAGVSSRYARTLLQELEEEGYLLPALGRERIHSYKLNSDKFKLTKRK